MHSPVRAQDGNRHSRSTLFSFQFKFNSLRFLISTFVHFLFSSLCFVFSLLHRKKYQEKEIYFACEFICEFINSQSIFETSFWFLKSVLDSFCSDAAPATQPSVRTFASELRAFDSNHKPSQRRPRPRPVGAETKTSTSKARTAQPEWARRRCGV